MSGRAEIAIEAVGIPPTLQLRLVLAPVLHIESQKVALPFTCNLSAMPSLDQSGNDAVRSYGQTMFNRLSEAHPAVKEALESALKLPVGQSCSLYFRLVSEVEQVHWETLCDAKEQFLALDRRWPVGRIAQPETHQYSWYNYVGPLRILALMSAAGCDATLEWEALYRAAEEARERGLEIEIALFVGQETLQDKINDEINAGKVKGTTLHPMPDRYAGIEDAIIEFRPQIIHFFCHGYAGHGLAQLELATLVDEQRGKTSGSTVLPIEKLKNIATLEGVNNLWLVTLNCCEGAAIREEAKGVVGSSMARSLAECGVPAVVGMAKALGVDDAHEFTGNFFLALLTALAGKMCGAKADVPVDVEWAEFLYRARVALCDLHGGNPAKNYQWALPVLYVRAEPFGIWLVDKEVRDHRPERHLVDKEMDKEMQERLGFVSAYLRTLPADAPDEVRDQAIATILQGVPAALHPDRLGNFEQSVTNAGAEPGEAATSMASE